MRCRGFFAAVAALLVCASAHGQGSLNFGNSSTTCVYCDFVGGQKVPVGNAFLAELMYAPDGTSGAEFDLVAVRLGAPASFGPLPGIFAGGTRTVPTITPAGGFGLFQVRVWESAYGSSYLEVLLRGQGGHAGKSAIVRVDTGDPTTTPAGIPGSLPNSGLTSFAIGGLDGGFSCIPEPSTLVLVALGTFCLLRLGKIRNI